MSRYVVCWAPALLGAPKQAVVDEHAQRLLDEERVALRHLGDAFHCRPCELDSTEEVTDQAVGLDLRQGFQRNQRCVWLAGRPSRTNVEELRTRKADDQDRAPSDPVGEIFEQIEERRLAPLDVVEDDDQRFLRRQSLEHLSDRPERLLDPGHRRSQAEQGREPIENDVAVLTGRQQGGELLPGLGSASLDR